MEVTFKYMNQPYSVKFEKVGKLYSGVITHKKWGYSYVVEGLPGLFKTTWVHIESDLQAAISEAFINHLEEGKKNV